MDAPTVTVMQTVIAAMGDVFTLVGTIITKITEQPVLLFLLAAGLIPVGIRIFKCGLQLLCYLYPDLY